MNKLVTYVIGYVRKVVQFVDDNRGEIALLTAVIAAIAKVAPSNPDVNIAAWAVLVVYGIIDVYTTQTSK